MSAGARRQPNLRHRARRAAVQAMYQWQLTDQPAAAIIAQIIEDGGQGRLDPVARAILRLATFELLERLEIPLKVVINEAVELAKTFGAEESFRYVNGVLDKVARAHRAEAGAAR